MKKAKISHPDSTESTPLDKIYELETKCEQINEIATDINSVVSRSRTSLDQAETKIEECDQSVNQGRRSLREAALLKASRAAVTGAVIGATCGGPVGCLVGIKLGAFMGLLSGVAVMASGVTGGILTSRAIRGKIEPAD